MQKIFLVFLFLIGVVVSGIAGIFSVSGLTTVFKGATFSILLMGSSLEIAKVSVSIFLHLYHKKLNILLLSYLIIALIILMGITSLGVYGYLSKAFFNSTNTSGMVIAVKNIESKIEIQNGKIKNLRGEIDQLINLPADEKKSWHTYRIQNLSKKIDEYSSELEKFNDQYIVERTKLNVLESEVGPLKYLAQAIYGDKDGDSIGKAVQILIICLVIVFDPLAILLIISSIKGYEILNEKVQAETSPAMEKILNNPIVSETLEIMEELAEESEEINPKFSKPIAKKKAPQKYKKKEILEEKTTPLLESIKKINEEDLPIDAISMVFEEDEVVEATSSNNEIIIQTEVPNIVKEHDIDKMYNGKPIIAGVFVD